MHRDRLRVGWRHSGRRALARRLAVGLALVGAVLATPIAAGVAPAGAASLPSPGTLDLAYGVGGMAAALPGAPEGPGPAELATLPPGAYTSGAGGDALEVSEAPAGPSGSSPTANLDVTRLTPAGALDDSFGSSGVTGLFPSPVGSTATVTPAGLALAAPGSYPQAVVPGDAVVAAAYQPSSSGSGATGLAVARVTPAGAPDPDFAATLSSQQPASSSSFGVSEAGVPPSSAGAATPGSVLLDLACPVASGSDAAPSLHLPATGGVALEEPGTPSGEGEPGDVLVGGIATCENTSYAVVVRLTPAGAPDPSFGSGGVASVALPTTLALGTPPVAGLVLEPGGDVLVVGAGASEGEPVLYEAGFSAATGGVDVSLGGTPDGVPGVAVTPYPSLTSITATAVTAVAGLGGASGTGAPLAVVGTAVPASGSAEPAVFALDASGGPVSSYGNAGVILLSGLASGASLRSVVPLGGGAAAVGGRVETGSGTSVAASVLVAELTPSGVPEPGFAPGSTVQGVSLQPCAALGFASCGDALTQSGSGGVLAGVAAPFAGAAGQAGVGFGAVEALWGPVAFAAPTTVKLSGSGGCLGFQVEIALTAPVYVPTDVSWAANRPPEAAAPTLGSTAGNCGGGSTAGTAVLTAGSTSATASVFVADPAAIPEGDVFSFAFALTGTAPVGGGLADAALVPASDTTITIDAPPPRVAGYEVLSTNGGVANFDAPWFGSLARRLPAGVSATGMAANPRTGGYWILTSNGGVANFDAPWFGSLNRRLPAGVSAVGIAADPLTGGYWILTSNGGVANFDAPWFGSLAGRPLSSPVRAVVAG